jgi:F-type H+-transporting ATPase subunit delta
VRTGPVARNYAEALYALGQRHDAVVPYGVLLDAVAGAVATEPRLHAVLQSPRVPKARKKQLLRSALGALAPEPFVRFLESVVQRGRQGILSEMSAEYEMLVDRHLNRVHAGVTTAHDVDPELARAIAVSLSAVVGKEVFPHFRTDPRLLGGLIVRVGDRVLDGSLRRRLLQLRYSMLHARSGGGA